MLLLPAPVRPTSATYSPGRTDRLTPWSTGGPPTSACGDGDATGEGATSESTGNVGAAPLRRIIELLKRKQYSGPVSLEIFQTGTAAIQNMDPFQLATRAKAAIEPLIA